MLQTAPILTPALGNNQNYYALGVDQLLDNSETDFDIYVDVADRKVLYGSSGYKWTRRELQALLKSGIDTLLIKSADQYKVQVYKEVNKLPEIEKNQPPYKRIVSIQNIAELFCRYLHEGHLTDSCIAKAKNIATSMTACLLEDHTAIKALGALADKDCYTYQHSARVAAYSVACAIQLGVTDQMMLADIAVGSLMHDIGKKDVPLEIINKTGALKDNEWQILKAHPTNGHDILQTSDLSSVSLDIVLHHHEKLDGSGYPHGIDKLSLSPEVQISTLADIFDALTSSRSYQQKRSRFEALDFIKHNLLGTKLSKEPFGALVACLI